jgi:hypothetical protein
MFDVRVGQSTETVGVAFAVTAADPPPPPHPIKMKSIAKAIERRLIPKERNTDNKQALR